MKKIFTLCLGVMIALSASATPQFNLRKATKFINENADFVPSQAIKSPAIANGETIVVRANDLYVAPHQYFDMYFETYGYGPVMFRGTNADWAVAGMFMATDAENFYGVYSSDQLQGAAYDLKNKDEQFMLSFSSFKYEQTKDGDQIIALATDSLGRTFDIALTFFAPSEPKDTISIDFGEVTMAMYASQPGGWYVYAENASYQAQLFILSDDLEGSYEKYDFYTDYTGVFAIHGKDTTFTGVPYDVKAEIKLEEGIYRIAAEIFAGDSNLYHLDMKYTKPIAKDTVSLSVEGVELADYTEMMGLFMLQVGPKDESYTISLGVIADQLEGSFTEKDLSYQYSFILINRDYIDIAEAEFTTRLGDQNVLTLEGWLLGANNIRYELLIKTAPVEIEAISTVETGIPATKRILNGQLLIEKNGVRYNVLGMQLR